MWKLLNQLRNSPNLLEVLIFLQAGRVIEILGNTARTLLSIMKFYSNSSVLLMKKYSVAVVVFGAIELSAVGHCVDKNLTNETVLEISG